MPSLPRLLLPVPMTSQQATVDPCFHQSLQNTHRQVSLNLLWTWFCGVLFHSFPSFFYTNYCRQDPGLSSVLSLSRVWLFATPWIAACQTSLSITNSQSSLRLTSIESVMPSSHLILCLSVYYHFAFSYCSWGSQGKNTEVVCHSLLQWTTFCQISPPWPAHLPNTLRKILKFEEIVLTIHGKTDNRNDEKQSKCSFDQ